MGTRPCASTCLTPTAQHSLLQSQSAHAHTCPSLSLPLILPHAAPPPPPINLPQDYFRDVTRADVSNLLSFIIDPEEDDALLVPQLGRAVREPLPASAAPHPPQLPPAGARGASTGALGSCALQDDDDGGEVRAAGAAGSRQAHGSCSFMLVVRGVCGA